MNLATDVLSSGIRLAVPILLAAIGELIAERSGVVNMGLEGMMTAGAFAAFLVTLTYPNSPMLALAAAVAAGALVGLIMAGFTVVGGANQIVTGLALVILVPGLVNFIDVQTTQHFTSIPVLGAIGVPGLDAIPVLGSAVFQQNIFFYIALGLALLLEVLLVQTRIGLSLSAAGHDPEIAAAKGVNTVVVRSLAVVVAGACAGLGGAALTLGALGTYTPGVVGGRGYVALAVVILGAWQMRWIVAGALLFGITDALQLRLTNVLPIPVDLFAMLPWIVVLLMLIIGSRHARVPRSLSRIGGTG